MIAHSAVWSALDFVLTDKMVRADAAYLVGETIDNASSVLERGAWLWRRKVVPRLATQKGGMGFGFCGFEYSLGYLNALGVERNSVAGIEYRLEDNDGKVNTLLELINAVRFAKRQGWQNMLIVAPEFHVRRAWLTGVTVVDREYPGFKVYGYVGTPLAKDETVVHSQGTLTATRRDLETAEDKRIVAYQKDGQPYPLVSVERALQYLRERDAR